MAVISVPMVRLPESSRWAPTTRTAQVEIAPRSSMEGKNTEKICCAQTFDSRFSAFSSSNWSWNRRSRLNAWMIAIPETDSATWAVTDAMRLRASSWATADLRWNQRVRMSVGGRITIATRPSRQSTTNSTTIVVGGDTTFEKGGGGAVE